MQASPFVQNGKSCTKGLFIFGIEKEFRDEVIYIVLVGYDG